MKQQNNPWKKSVILFLISQSVTVLGSSLVQMAIIWFVTLKTSSGFWVSALTICSFIPQMLISFFAGVWADRYERKRLIILADGIIAVATLILAWLIPYIEEDTTLLIGILSVSIIRSLGAGVQSPAIGAMIPQLVPEEHLMRFNGINGTIQSVIQFATPALAGTILSLGAFQNTLFIDVSTAVVGIGLLACIIIPNREKMDNRPSTSIFSDMIEGIKYSFSDRLIGKLLLVYGGFIFFSIPSGFLSALLVTRTFGEKYLYLTIVEMVGFIGMMLGGLMMGTWGGFTNRIKTLLVGVVGYAICSIAAGLTHGFTIYTIIIFFLSLAIPLVQSAVMTLIQEKANPSMQGRVFGLLSIAYSGFLPIGMALFGPAADIVSVQTLMIISGIILFTMTILLQMKRVFNRKEEHIQGCRL